MVIIQILVTIASLKSDSESASESSYRTSILKASNTTINPFGLFKHDFWYQDWI